MKKLIFSIITLMVFFAPPTTQAQFRWGAEASYQNDNLLFKQELITIKPVSAYSAGVVGEMMFPGIGFGLSFGLQYNQQGAMVNLGEREIWKSQGYGNEHIYLHSIRIPVHLRFKYTRLNGIEDKIAPLIYVGPDFNIQAAHGHCDAFKYSGGDLGLTVGGGAELYKRWQVTGGYSWGMTYALKTKLLDDFSARSRQWHVRVAYFF